MTRPSIDIRPLGRADVRDYRAVRQLALESPRESHKAFLWGVFVAPEMRRLGIGDRLFDAVQRHMRGTVEQLLLTVVAENDAAIALYRQHGFTPYGREPRSLRTATGWDDELLMVLFLAPGA